MKYNIFVILILLFILPSTIAVASEIGNNSYSGIIQATNNSTVATKVCVPFTLNTTAYINAGLINSTASNVAALSDTGSDTAIMPGYGGNPWIIYFDSVPANASRGATLYTGDVTGGEFAYFPGSGGMTIPDAAVIDPGSGENWTMSLHGYFDTSQVGANITRKDNVFWLGVTSVGYLNLIVPGVGGSSHQFTSQECTLDISIVHGPPTGSSYIKVTWPENYNDVSLSANLTDNANDIVIGNLNASPFITSVNITTSGGGLVGSWEWEYGATFTDLSGNGNDATPTFRTTSSDADVSANLTSFLPVTEAEADLDIDDSSLSMLTAVPDQPATAYSENSTPGIFFAPIITAIWPDAVGPTSIFWYGFAFFIIIGAGMLIYYAFASNNQRALLIKIILMMAIMVFWALPGPNIYGMYVPIYFGMFCFGAWVASRSYGL